MLACEIFELRVCIIFYIITCKLLRVRFWKLEMENYSYVYISNIRVAGRRLDCLWKSAINFKLDGESVKCYQIIIWWFYFIKSII